jgi:phenol hydroxylase P0 protein
MEDEIFDPNRKFVRVIENRPDGLVGFEFAVGEPELFVELMMSGAAFNEFCTVNQVTLLAPKAVRDASGQAGEQQSDWDWGMRQATQQRFKSTE